MQAWFIAGTDTGVGKTLASCALLKAAASAGYTTAGMKPVAAGAEITKAVCRNEDALLLLQSSTLQLPYERVNPVCLKHPFSPHLAARREKQLISMDMLITSCRDFMACGADFILVEGAGGWRVPINDEELLSALPVKLQMPVILVVGMRLGCLNHALLTAEAIRNDGLELAGWVANGIDPDFECRDENIQTLQSKLDAPLLADIPWSPGDDPGQTAGRFCLEMLSSNY